MRSVKLVCALCFASACPSASAVPAGIALPGTDKLFISPMGEPFRASSANKNLASIWFENADLDADQALSIVEMQADAARFFSLIDSDANGEIEPEEMAHYENHIAPEIRVPLPADKETPRDSTLPAEPDHQTVGRAGGQSGLGRKNREPSSRKAPLFDPRDHQWVPQGAALFGILDLPQPVAAADANMDRLVTHAEFMSAARQRFAVLDSNGDRSLTRSELPRPTRHKRLPTPPLSPVI